LPFQSGRRASTVREYELGGDGWSFRQVRPGDGEVMACEKHGNHRFQFSVWHGEGLGFVTVLYGHGRNIHQSKRRRRFSVPTHSTRLSASRVRSPGAVICDVSYGNGEKKYARLPYAGM
jgi:hypothetical protein